MRRNKKKISKLSLWKQKPSIVSHSFRLLNDVTITENI